MLLVTDWHLCTRMGHPALQHAESRRQPSFGLVKSCLYGLAGGRIGLLDYGQSKQLPDESRLAFAELVLALWSGDNPRISAAMYGLGVITEKGAEATRCKMAYGMFDTRGR